MMSSSNLHNRSLVNQFIPSQCIVLWIALALAIPLTITTIAKLGTPILSWLEGFMSTFNPELLESEFTLPQIPPGIIILSIIGIIVCFALFVSIQAIYINNWYLAADRKDLYKPSKLSDSILSLSFWFLYRMFFILMPVIIMTLLSMTMLFVSVKFFNIIAKFMGINLELVISLSIFTALLTGFFWLVAILLTVWNALTSVYGSIIAVVEPNISNALIRKRSRRFAFLTSSSWGAYIVYVFMLCVYFLQFVYLLLNPSFLSLQNIPLIVLIQVVNIVLFIGLGRSITFSYYKSLLIQFAKISVKKSKILSSNNDSTGYTPDKYSVSFI